MNTDAEKLIAIRERLKWSQGRMADALGLDRGYVNQLENGRKPIKPWVLERADIIESGVAAGVENATGLRESGPTRNNDLQIECREHFNRFLETCQNDPARLGWTLVEVRRKFPLDHWAGEPEGRTPAVTPNANSTLVEKAAVAGRAAASTVFDEHGDPERQPRTPTREPSANKS